jgi:hypothetical protein
MRHSGRPSGRPVFFHQQLFISGEVLMKFQVHGIKTARGLEKARYMISDLADGRKCITICADGYTGFSGEVREAFAVENDSDIMTDYFENDSFRAFPEHPLFQEVAAGFRMKVSRYGDHARRTLEELNRLALTAS